MKLRYHQDRHAIGKDFIQPSFDLEQGSPLPRSK